MIIAAIFAASRIAVISVGTDPIPSGQLQQGVESRLVALPSVELKDAGVIAVEIGVKGEGGIATAPDPDKREKLETLLEAARQSSRNGDYDDALEQLVLAEGLVDPVSTDDRVRILLQRSAVLLKMDDRDKAAASARTALELQPDLAVDLGVFPPSVNSLVSEVRATLPVRYTIELQHVPANARVLLDGRAVGGRFAASPGRHKLRVASPGFRTIDLVLDVSKNASVDAALPIALEKTLETALFEQMWSTDPAAKERTAARDLAARLNVDGLVLIGSRSTPSAEARALVVWTKSAEPPEVGPTKPTSQAAGRSALTEWIAAHVEKGPARGPIGVLEPSRRPRSPAAWNFRGGLAMTSRHRTVSGLGGAGFETDFVGAGPLVFGEMRKRGFTMQLEAGSQQYGSRRVNRPEGGKATLPGGTGIRGRFGLGYGLGADWLRVTALVGPRVDQFGSATTGTENAELGLHPSQIWVNGYGRLEVTGLVRERWSFHAAGMYGVPGLSDVSENPENTTGDFEGASPGTFSSVVFEAGLGWQPVERLWVGGELAHETRTVLFEGAVNAPFTPQIVDAKDRQTIDTFQVFGRYRFGGAR